MAIDQTTFEQELVSELQPLIQEARKKGLWLFNLSNSRETWLSPDELATHNEEGNFIFGEDHWQLRNPKEHERQLERRSERATNQARKELEDFRNRM